MSWKRDISLRDLDDGDNQFECICLRCQFQWLYKPSEMMAKAKNKYVTIDEMEQSLVCPRPHCRHVGAEISLTSRVETSGFVAGMP